MDDRTLREYEGRLFGNFTQDDGRRVPTVGEAEPPEWLMTGVWLPVPPDRDRLNDAARSFANEFAPPSGSSGREADRVVARGPSDRQDADAGRRDETPRVVNPDAAPTPPHGEKLK